ncbi:hypothetical protein N7535_008921 [Penicillium sp. DV-2018c]|nr:hypothetical protein N7535_008921 [Penicillium sp. DV-2018c]
MDSSNVIVHGIHLLLVWNAGKGSPIPTTQSHYIMKILAGTLQETVYRIPGRGMNMIMMDLVRWRSNLIQDILSMMLLISRMILGCIGFGIGSDQIAVSLHLYTPPNAADYGYNVYNENTGKASFVPQQSC